MLNNKAMKIVQKAGGIVINPNGEVLLVTNQLGRTTFPKGGLELGETPKQAAKREILEEGGLKKVSIIKELGIIERPGYTERNSKTPSVIKQIRIYLCTTEEFDLKPSVKDIASAEWVTPENVVELLSWEEEKEFFEAHRNHLRF